MDRNGSFPIEIQAMSGKNTANSVADGTEIESAIFRILLVEDDPALRLMLRNVLELHDYEVVEADSKATAEKVLISDPAVAVVILDLGLPPSPHTTLEGLAVIKLIVSQMYPVKIVVLTGQDEESSALEAIREGAFDFLAKPSRSEEILSAVQRAVLFHRQEKQLAKEGLTKLQFNAKVADGLKAVREEAEEKLVRHVLKDTKFNVYQSAARLGLKRESIYYFLKKFGIKRDNG